MYISACAHGYVQVCPSVCMGVCACDHFKMFFSDPNNETCLTEHQSLLCPLNCFFFLNRKKDYQSFKTQNQEAQQPLERHTLVFMKEKATHEFNNLFIKLMVFFWTCFCRGVFRLKSCLPGYLTWLARKPKELAAEFSPWVANCRSLGLHVYHMLWHPVSP